MLFWSSFNSNGQSGIAFDHQSVADVGIRRTFTEGSEERGWLSCRYRSLLYGSAKAAWCFLLELCSESGSLQASHVIIIYMGDLSQRWVCHQISQQDDLETALQAMEHEPSVDDSLARYAPCFCSAGTDELEETVRHRGEMQWSNCR